MDDYQVEQKKDHEVPSVSKSDDQIWRQFYEHSYAVQFKCPQCGSDFDIDGWFFKFEPVRCSKCGLKFQGLFGRVMSSSSSSSGQIDLETFEGDKGAVSIPGGSYNLTSIIEHIILILYMDRDQKNPVPFGLIDYFAQKPRFLYFGKSEQISSNQQKPKSIFATLFS